MLISERVLYVFAIHNARIYHNTILRRCEKRVKDVQAGAQDVVGHLFNIYTALMRLQLWLYTK